MSLSNRTSKFWYSAKHAAWYRHIGNGPTTIEINGQRLEYTEATSIEATHPSCSTERGGKFDDYILLGITDNWNSFNKEYTEAELQALRYDNY